MTKVIALLAKMDAKIIDVAQDTYLWLLDRTGIYVATIGLLLWSGSLACFNWTNTGMGITIILIIIGAVNLLILGYRYHLQGNGNNKAFNTQAEGFREMITMRWWFNSQMILFMTLDLLTLDGKGVLMNILILVYNFAPAIMIRDREKKPLFESKRELAMAENNAH